MPSSLPASRRLSASHFFLLSLAVFLTFSHANRGDDNKCRSDGAGQVGWISANFSSIPISGSGVLSLLEAGWRSLTVAGGSAGLIAQPASLSDGDSGLSTVSPYHVGRRQYANSTLTSEALAAPRTSKAHKTNRPYSMLATVNAVDRTVVSHAQNADHSQGKCANSTMIGAASMEMADVPHSSQRGRHHLQYAHSTIDLGATSQIGALSAIFGPSSEDVSKGDSGLHSGAKTPPCPDTGLGCAAGACGCNPIQKCYPKKGATSQVGVCQMAPIVIVVISIWMFILAVMALSFCRGVLDTMEARRNRCLSKPLLPPIMHPPDASPAPPEGADLLYCRGAHQRDLIDADTRDLIDDRTRKSPTTSSSGRDHD